MASAGGSAAGGGAVEVDGTFFHSLHADLQGKTERFGKPNPRQMLALFKKLTPDVRTTYGWVGTEISLRNPDHGVREIQRTFQKLGWDFQNAQVVKGSRPPDFDLFLVMVKDLARYFDTHPATKVPAGSTTAVSAPPSVWNAGPCLLYTSPSPRDRG